MSKTMNLHARRVRKRRRLSAADPFRRRLRKFAKHIDTLLARFQALPASITAVVNVGGTGYAVGDRFEINGGTSTLVATGIVTTAAAGVVTGFSITQGGGYTVNPGVAATTTATSGSGVGLTVNTTLTGTPAAATADSVIDSLKREPVVEVGAREQRAVRSSQDAADIGIPIA